MTMAAPLAVAALCAALMGFAIQRGATCLVAAVDEWTRERRLRRLAAMLEASVWVAGGLLLAQWAGLPMAMPRGFVVSGWTVAGGLLLGLGAWLNGACVFGAIARLASGEAAYAATPLGFYLGCLAVPLLFAPAAPQPSVHDSPLFAAPQGLALAFVAYMAWRVGRPLAAGRWRELAARVWQPHAATAVIGASFVVSLLAVGAWAYTDLLADLARGRAGPVLARVALFVALLLGAGVGGAQRWKRAEGTRPAWPAPRAWLRCIAGGALMGSGTLLIPGSNDGLILIGVPLLWPHAALALATMVLTIATAQAAARWLDRRRAARRQCSQIDHGAAAGDRAA